MRNLITAANKANSPNDRIIFEVQPDLSETEAQLNFQKSNYSFLARKMAWLIKKTSKCSKCHNIVDTHEKMYDITLKSKKDSSV